MIRLKTGVASLRSSLEECNKGRHFALVFLSLEEKGLDDRPCSVTLKRVPPSMEVISDLQGTSRIVRFMKIGVLYCRSGRRTTARRMVTAWSLGNLDRNGHLAEYYRECALFQDGPST
jgi:hypothetical protein